MSPFAQKTLAPVDIQTPTATTSSNLLTVPQSHNDSHSRSISINMKPVQSSGYFAIPPLRPSTVSRTSNTESSFATPLRPSVIAVGADAGPSMPLASIATFAGFNSRTALANMPVPAAPPPPLPADIVAAANCVVPLVPLISVLPPKTLPMADIMARVYSTSIDPLLEFRVPPQKPPSIPSSACLVDGDSMKGVPSYIPPPSQLPPPPPNRPR